MAKPELRISPIIVSLLGCLEIENKASESPDFCRIGPMPAGSVIIDACGECVDGSCGGQGWVRLVNSFASTDFPLEDPIAQCGSKRAFTLEVGIARCMASMDEDGEPPSVEDVTKDWAQQMTDMETMRRAIACCFGRDFEGDYVLGGYLPSPDQGDCGYATWTVLVRP